MSKTQFGKILHKARSDKGMSLRQLSAQSGIEFTRLSRMEHGTRPAPGLPQLRRLAELLSLDLVDLLVSAGTPREAVEQLLWSERLQQAKRVKTLAEYHPEGHRARVKNEFTVEVLAKDGALCTVKLGSETWQLLTFSDAEQLRVVIPPQAIQIFSEDPREILLSSYNVFRARVDKTRRAGPLLNLVLKIGGIELNALMTEARDEALRLRVGDRIYVSISPAALSTEPHKGVKGRK